MNEKRVPKSYKLAWLQVKYNVSSNCWEDTDLDVFMWESGRLLNLYESEDAAGCLWNLPERRRRSGGSDTLNIRALLCLQTDGGCLTWTASQRRIGSAVKSSSLMKDSRLAITEQPITHHARLQAGFILTNSRAEDDVLNIYLPAVKSSILSSIIWAV